MFTQTTLADSPSAISSLASVSGAWPYAEQDGQTTDLFGPVPVLANLSARQAQELGLLTSGTYGRISTGSSKSAALQSSLESKLRAATQTLGSTLYKMTWKDWDTGSGRSRFRLRASVLRTSATDSTGWPTPTAALAEKGVRTFEGGIVEAMRNHGPDLAAVACLTGWPTPQTSDSTGGGQAKRAMGEARHGSNLNDFAMLAGWPTTTATDALRCPSIESTTPNITLNHAANLATWATPSARDWHSASASPEFLAERAEQTRGKPLSEQAFTLLPGPARLTASGELLTGVLPGWKVAAS